MIIKRSQKDRNFDLPGVPDEKNMMTRTKYFNR